MTDLWKGEELVAVLAYTDGTHDEAREEAKKTAWAAVLVGKTRCGKDVVMGTLEGRVHQQAPQEIGSDRKTNQSAEMSGLYWAMAWAEQCDEEFKLELHTDSDVCRGCLEDHGRWKVHVGLGETLRGLMDLQRERRSAKVFHVKGHNGHAYNELADRLAERAARTEAHHSKLPLHGRFRQQRWWSMVLSTRRGDATLPKVNKGILEVSLPQDGRGASVGDMYAKEVKGRKSATPLSIQVVSVNVLSLAGEHERREKGETQKAPTKRRSIGRRNVLQNQFFKDGCKLIGVQEARSQAGTWASQHYLNLAAGATSAGQHGVEVWVAKSWGEGKSAFTVKESDCQVRFATPRALLVSIRSPRIKLDAFVGHAPHSGHSEADQREWWKATMAEIDKRDDKIPLYVMMDTNGYVAEQEADGCSFGVQLSDKSNLPGQLMAVFFERYKLFAPATFKAFNTKPLEPTFIARNAGTVIDYVGLPRSQRGRVVRAGVMEAFDMDGDALDHRPTSATVVAKMGETQDYEWVKRRNIGYDRQKLNDPTVLENIREELSKVCSPTWAVEVNQHEQEITRKVVEILKQHCPKKDKPLRPHVSDETYEWVRVKNKLKKKVMEEVEKAMKEEEEKSEDEENVGDLAGSYEQIEARRKEKEDRRRARKKELRANAEHGEILIAMETETAKRLEVDKSAYIHETMLRAETAAASGDSRELHRCVKRLRPWQPKKLALIQDKDGNIAETPLQARQTWQKHFAEILGGKTATFDNLVTQSCMQDEEHWQNAQVETLTHVISKGEVAMLCRSLKPYKATGIDTIPPELMKRLPGECAEILFPLLFKATICQIEPVAYKGGQVIELQKKGSPQDVRNYRGVVLLNTAGKILHNFATQRIEDRLTGALRETQYGATRHKGTDLASLHVRQHFAKSRQQDRSCAAVFIDAVGAFDNVQRDLLFQEEGSEVMLKLGIDPVLIQQAKSAHRQTWTVVEGMGDATHTSQGVRPGDSYGSMFFNILMTRVLEEIATELAEKGIGLVLPRVSKEQLIEGSNDEEVNFDVDVSYVDDGTFLLQDNAKNPAAMIDNVQSMLETIEAAFHRCGLDLNFKRGKTEVVADIRGPKSRDVKAKIYGPEPWVTIKTTRGDRKVGIVQSYVHLGTTLQTGAKLSKEIATRAGKAKAALQDLRRTLRTKGVSEDTKKRLIEAMIASRLMYNCGTWCGVTKKQHATIRKVLVHAVRVAKGLFKGGKPIGSNRQVLREANMEDIAPRIARAKINVLQRVLRFGGASLRATVSQGPWITEAFELIEKARGDEKWRSTPCCQEDPFFWLHLLTQPEMKATAHQLKNAVAANISREQEEEEKKEDEEEEGKEDDEVWCPERFQVFQSVQAAASHRTRAHGYTHRAWTFAASGACEGCGTQYWTRRRLVDHWKGKTGKACLICVEKTCLPLDGKETQKLARQEELAEPTLCARPSQRWLSIDEPHHEVCSMV